MKIPAKPRNLERSNARLMAVQALYQQALAPKPAADVVREFIQFRLNPYEEAGEIRLPELDKRLFGDVVTGVAITENDLNGMIVGHLDPDWRFERLDRVLVAILQAGLWELLHKGDTPARVIINEYVEVARSFFEGKEPGFVNKVLDSAGRKLRTGEFGQS